MDSRAIINVIDNLESTNATDALSANMGRELNNNKQDKIVDSDWITLTLSGDVIQYDAAIPPQYRRIGNKVYLRGAVKNITTSGTTIAILPEGYRPTMTHNYLQLTSIQGGSPNFTRMKVTTAGVLMLESISTGITATYHEDRWYPIHTSYLID